MTTHPAPLFPSVIGFEGGPDSEISRPGFLMMAIEERSLLRVWIPEDYGWKASRLSIFKALQDLAAAVGDRVICWPVEYRWLESGRRMTMDEVLSALAPRDGLT